MKTIKIIKENSDDRYEELKTMVVELIRGIREYDVKIPTKCTTCILLLERIGMVLREIQRNNN
ncbi:MAG: hypothetical protein AB1779_09055 [Candidatus Thermoplasmatota archaeon]